MKSKENLKEIIFYYFDEIEHYAINKGFSKATLEELINMYQDAFNSGYREALGDMEKNLDELNDKNRLEIK